MKMNSAGARVFRVIAVCWWLAASATGVAETAVSAALSQNSAGVGEAVELHIKVTEARSAVQPPAVEVEGLRISYLGPSESTSMSFGNGGMKRETSVTFRYQVEATRAGNFTIPAVNVTADGHTLTTQPVVLKAETGSSRGGEAALGTLEVKVPRKTAYVGEMVPVEIRLAVDARVHWEVQSMPEIPGEGFTKQKLPAPRRESATKDGHEQDVVVFRTAITPGQAGKITLGPIEVPYVAQVPRAQKRNRSRSLFDLFDDNVFGDPFFATNQRFVARAEAVELEVKSLPAGRPKNFSGAVGQFEFSGSGAPDRVKIGDPVTMKLIVRGRGNFDRVGAPALLGAAGWRSYPASADFKPDDELGISGAKTFSVAVIPEAAKTAMPVFEFPYFDPATEKYVTLTSALEPLIVEGTPPPTSTPAPREVRPVEPPTPAPARDILGLRYDTGGGRHSFEPLYRQRGFLLAQLAPLAVLLALLVFKLGGRNAEAKRRAAWRQERADSLARLRRGELPDGEFLDLAARIIQGDVALATGRPPGSVDAAGAHAARPLDPETADGIDFIFNARAAALYAGVSGGGEGLTADRRRTVLATLASFERAPARA